MVQTLFFDYFEAFALSLVVSTASVTLCKAGIFRGLRRFVASRSKWLGELIHCPYCASHWISLLLVVVYRPCLTRGNIAILDYLVSVLAIVAMATFWSKYLCASLHAMDLLRDRSDRFPVIVHAPGSNEGAVRWAR